MNEDLLEADADANADADAEDGEVSASLHTASAAFCSSEVRGDTLVDSFLISQLPSEAKEGWRPILLCRAGREYRAIRVVAIKVVVLPVVFPPTSSTGLKRSTFDILLRRLVDLIDDGLPLRLALEKPKT